MKRPRAFTLIELLVVIAIISLLVSILLPSLNKAKMLARRAVCAANQHHLYLSIGLYAEENDTRMPQLPVNFPGLATMYASGFDVVTVESGVYPPNEYRWWGLGQLLESGIAEPSEMFMCPDFESDYYQFLSNRPDWEGEVSRAFNGDSMGGSLQAEYALNTSMYYTDRGDGEGEFGLPGPEGAYWDPDKSWYGPVSQVTSLLQCVTSATSNSYSHNREGFNCLFVRGDVQWIEVNENTWGTWNSGIQYWGNLSGRRSEGYGLWPYASYMGGQ